MLEFVAKLALHPVNAPPLCLSIAFVSLLSVMDTFVVHASRNVSLLFFFFFLTW